MTLSLLDVNICQFNDCGLQFASLSDLLQHIEETHIPIIDEEMKKKEELEKCSTSDDETLKTAASNTACPLSVIFRFFTTLPPNKAIPIKSEPVKLAIGHYRKKIIPSNITSAYGQSSDKSRFEHDEESNDSYKNEDGDDFEQGADERRHKCPVEGCNKRYKNLQGARYHARQVHGYTEDSSTVSFDLTPVVPGQVAPLIQSNAPSKYANLRPYKCSHCSKRYKTIVGLNNHVQQSHQRINPVGNQNLPANIVSISQAGVSVVTNISTPSPGTPTHGAAETNGTMAVVSSGYLSSTAVQNQVTQAIRLGTQTIASLSSPTTAGHQLQQSNIVPKLIATSTTARNMNVLSSYAPQSNESASSLIARSDLSLPRSNQPGHNK